MNLKPKKLKFEKYHKGIATNRIISKNTYNIFRAGTIVLKTLINYRLTSKQLEVLYITINKYLKRLGSVIIPVFPHTPISKKPNEIRMGKGKGAVDHWVCRVLAGTSICEIETNNIQKALKAIKFAKFRLPISVRTVISH